MTEPNFRYKWGNPLIESRFTRFLSIDSRFETSSDWKWHGMYMVAVFTTDSCSVRHILLDRGTLQTWLDSGSFQESFIMNIEVWKSPSHFLPRKCLEATPDCIRGVTIPCELYDETMEKVAERNRFIDEHFQSTHPL